MSNEQITKRKLFASIANHMSKMRAGKRRWVRGANGRWHSVCYNFREHLNTFSAAEQEVLLEQLQLGVAAE